KQKIFLIVNVKTDNAAINYAKAEREIAAMEEMLLQPVQPKKPVKAKLGEFTSNQSREQYNKNVLRCKEYIKNGDAFQIVYAQRFSATYDQSLFSAYRYLRTTNPSQYMVFLHNDDVEIAGSSPETLVKVVGKRVISMPIAGTRRRGKTSDEDKALEQELLADAKEIAEHNMLVDLGLNDVGRVCDFGSVKVSDYKAIKRFSHVMHITSKVTGQLSADKDALDALRAVFPAGTLSGAPKIRACEIIDELEPERRGIYGGGMGYLDFGGNMDICITIRTMVKKNDRVYIQAGGGIVADSVLDNEFQETVNKAGACMTALCMTAEEE
ncbi:anthranilate synthase component I family protein, partial [Phascolarctobacterium succinatutens]